MGFLGLGHWLNDTIHNLELVYSTMVESEEKDALRKVIDDMKEKAKEEK